MLVEGGGSRCFDFELCAVRRSAQPGQVRYVKELRTDGAVAAVPPPVDYGGRGDVESGHQHRHSFDIHGDALLEHRRMLGDAARRGGAVAVVAAGWDPGVDSIIRCLMEAMAPKGVTYTDFGPGMSMGHSVAARSVPGVADARSFTLPVGFGVHRRQVYVQLDGTRPFEEVEADIKADPYFAHDDTRVMQVESAADYHDTGHGVSLKRYGAAGTTGNQQMEWRIRVINPAATGQCMLSALRAGLKMAPGAYTMAELPVISMLPGGLEEIVKGIV